MFFLQKISQIHFRMFVPKWKCKILNLSQRDIAHKIILYQGRWEDDLNYKAEDNLNIFLNGTRPQINSFVCFKNISTDRNSFTDKGA
jgi:hypothetical protein